MKIAVLGAGAIGALAGGYLKLKNHDVVLIAGKSSVEKINKNNLLISGIRGNFNISVPAAEKLTFQPECVILSVKTQDVENVVRENISYLYNIPILTVQNGVRSDSIVARFIPEDKIISSIIMFGATYLNPGEVIHNFEGTWIVGSMSGSPAGSLEEIRNVFNDVFPVIVTDNIQGMKYLKLFVNANNCLPAILGVSIQEAFADKDVSAISIAIWKEGMGILKKAGLRAVSLPDFPVERIIGLTSIPLAEAAGIFSGIMVSLSKEPLYGSILQSIKRGKPSEIDYINGEFVALAREHDMEAPLNQKLVDMVHGVEKTGKFFSRRDLLSAVKNEVAAGFNA
ncbi:MAG: 2-dehydropantoate 2-reductase [Candidatus Omnitrophica bacterium]|nr:2-dehydropantoate 2-reductase [Candidatus Omnitrophota bacterium]